MAICHGMFFVLFCLLWPSAHPHLTVRFFDTISSWTFFRESGAFGILDFLNNALVLSLVTSSVFRSHIEDKVITVQHAVPFPRGLPFLLKVSSQAHLQDAVVALSCQM